MHVPQAAFSPHREDPREVLLNYLRVVVHAEEELLQHAMAAYAQALEAQQPREKAA